MLKESLSGFADKVFHRYNMNKAFSEGLQRLEEEVPFTPVSYKLLNLVYRYSQLLPGTFGNGHESIEEVINNLNKLRILRKRINYHSKKFQIHKKRRGNGGKK